VHWEPLHRPGAPLAKNTIEVWLASLEVEDKSLQVLWQWLSPVEQKRIARLRFPERQRQKIASYAYLRYLLGFYLNKDPRELCFTYHKFGKPYLQGVPLEFNLSHAQNKLLLAFAAEFPLGIDLEYHKANRDCLKLAQRFFSAKEVLALEALKGRDLVKGFYQLWSSKEAVLKAWGRGLNFPLKNLSISLDQDTAEAPKLWALKEAGVHAKDCQLFNLPQIENFSAALAVLSKEQLKLQTYCLELPGAIKLA